MKVEKMPFIPLIPLKKPPSVMLHPNSHFGRLYKRNRRETGNTTLYIQPYYMLSNISCIQMQRTFIKQLLL